MRPSSLTLLFTHSALSHCSDTFTSVPSIHCQLVIWAVKPKEVSCLAGFWFVNE